MLPLVGLFAPQVIGALPLIDSEEVDVKILVVSAESPLFTSINGPADLEILKPGFLRSLKEWFEGYKEGQRNKLGYGGRVLGPVEAWQIIREAHESYQRLLANKHRHPNIWFPPSAQG